MSTRRLAVYLVVLAALAFGVYRFTHSLLESVNAVAAGRAQAAGKVN